MIPGEGWTPELLAMLPDEPPPRRIVNLLMFIRSVSEDLDDEAVVGRYGENGWAWSASRPALVQVIGAMTGAGARLDAISRHALPTEGGCACLARDGDWRLCCAECQDDMIPF